MFHWDRGIFLNRPRLGLDVRRGQPHGFVSHAHADHMARHQTVYCTPATGALMRARLGPQRQLVELPYRISRAFGDVQLTTYPAGHCLGSAMLLVEGGAGPEGEESLLYTGDFKLSASQTAEQAELPSADVLIMECTFGRPQYRMPPRGAVEAELVELVRGLLQEGRTPVIHAYPLGKSQETTRLLTAAGIGVLQHPTVFAISEVYRQCGVDLGDVRAYDARLVEGRVVVTLPKQSPNYRLPGIADPVGIAVTGWAIDAGTRFRWQVEHALPLSDHADFEELLETPRRVAPRRIYCTHGPNDFVDFLRAEGWDAHPVVGSYQQRLFT